MDIGTGSVKHVWVRKEKDTYHLLGFGLRERPLKREGTESAEIERALTGILSDPNLQPEEVVVAISGPEGSIQQSTLPKMTAKERADAIAWRGRLKKFAPLPQAVWDSSVLGELQKEGAMLDNVIVASVKKEKLIELTALLTKLGLAPERATLAPMALAALFRVAGGAGENELVAAVDIGSDFTRLVLLKGNRVQFIREFPVGGRAISEAMTVAMSVEQGRIALSLEDAEQVKRRVGIPELTSKEVVEGNIPVSRLAILERPALERIVGEIRRSFDYYLREFGDKKVDRVLLTGGSSRLKNLSAYLGQNLQVKVDLFDPLKPFALDAPGLDRARLEELAPRLATALGLALEEGGINLRSEFIRPRRAAKQGLIVGAAVLGATVLILGMFTLLLGGRSSHYERILAEIGDRLTALTRIRADRSRLETEQGRLDALAGELEVLRARDPAIVDALRELSRILPTNVEISELVISPQARVGTAPHRVLQVVGQVVGDRALHEVYLAELLLTLDRSPYFARPIFTSQQTATEGGGVVRKFNLSTDLE